MSSTGYPYDLNQKNIQTWGERLNSIVVKVESELRGRTYFLTTAELFEIVAKIMVTKYIFSDAAIIQQVKFAIDDLNARASHHAQTGD